MALRLVWTVGDVVRKLMVDQKTERGALAKESHKRPNTITNLINNNVTPDDKTLQAVAPVLHTSAEEIREEAARLNARPANGHVVPMRLEKTREEDRDDAMQEAVQYGKRIGKLPRFARMALYTMVAALEDAFLRNQNDRKMS